MCFAALPLFAGAGGETAKTAWANRQDFETEGAVDRPAAADEGKSARFDPHTIVSKTFKGANLPQF